MGEAARDILDGFVCQHCGETIDGEAPGYPRSCCEESKADTGTREQQAILYREIFAQHGFEIKTEKEINHGTQFTFKTGEIVCVYNTGRFSCGGVKNRELKNLMFKIYQS